MKLAVTLVFLVFTLSYGQTTLKKVSDFKSFTGADNFVNVSDTLQGGFFNLYTGADMPDGGMIFSDGASRKWKRYTIDSKVKLKWYGLKPYNNYGEKDDAVIIRKAIKYVENHRSDFNTIKADLCQFNEWYFIASTLYLNGVNLEGEGSEKRPKTLFQVKANTTAFRITQNNDYVHVKYVAVRHYRNSPNTTDSTHHSFDIHGVISFESVSVLENPNGDGFHIDACGYADVKDTMRFGNADQSRFSDCFADMCINGFWINGCDANVISFNDCSASSNQRWGVHDNGLLGNKYWNLHLANNGKTSDTKQTGATLRGDTATYFLREDIGPASIGKRPDLHPEIWYQNSTGLGGVAPWSKTKQYYTGGGVWAANPNSNHLFIGTYTESYSPANIISARSNWIEGLNGADIIGGMYEHTYAGYKFFTGNGIQSNVVATPILRMQGENGEEVDLNAKSMKRILSGTGGSNQEGHWIFPIGAQTTNITTGNKKLQFRVPFGCIITGIRVQTNTSSTTTAPVFDVLVNGTSILARKVSIDIGEKTSVTAESVPQILAGTIPDDAEISVSILNAGSGVNGVKIVLYYRSNIYP